MIGNPVGFYLGVVIQFINQAVHLHRLMVNGLDVLPFLLLGEGYPVQDSLRISFDRGNGSL